MPWTVQDQYTKSERSQNNIIARGQSEMHTLDKYLPAGYQKDISLSLWSGGWGGVVRPRFCEPGVLLDPDNANFTLK